jgi:uncharacterized protein YjbI with pentapeptide repeats
MVERAFHFRVLCLLAGFGAVSAPALAAPSEPKTPGGGFGLSSDRREPPTSPRPTAPLASVDRTTGPNAPTDLSHSIGGVCHECNFQGLNMRGLVLTNAAFQQSVFASSNMLNAHFRQSDLSGAHFISADMRYLTAEKIDMSRTQIEGTNLDHADLRDVKLTNASMERISMRGSKLNGCDLSRVTVKEGNLSNSSWMVANLKGARLINVSLDGLDGRQVRMDGFVMEGGSAVGAMFYSANLRNAVFDRVNLTNAKFDSSRLDGANLSTSTGLTAEALATACGDSRTRLPAGLRVKPC